MPLSTKFFSSLAFSLLCGMLHQSFILLGSNIGDCGQNLQQAIHLIENNLGKTLSKSSVYKTAAWGNKEQNDFFNQVVLLETLYNPHELLKELLSIELQMGRTRNTKWEPRVIDLDILYFNDMVLNENNLIIPHPFLHQRRFTLEPLCEIAANYFHPLLRQSNMSLLEICEDSLSVEKL